MKTNILIVRGILFLLVATWTIGCQGENPVGVVDPPKTNSPEFIKLAPINRSLSKIVTSSAFITAKDGGTLTLSYTTSTSSLNLNIDFPPGAVSQDITVSVSLDDTMKTIRVTFSPSPTYFLKPAQLDVYATGLDFSGLPSNAQLNFYYYNEGTGTWEQMPTKLLSENIQQSWLKCVDGQVPHFSIYAFGR